MTRRRSRWSGVALAIAFVALAGCGSGMVRVRGKVVKNGQPYTVELQAAEPDTFAIDFVGSDGTKRYLFPATAKSDGTFTVPGQTGAGVPKGTYKIAVLHSGYVGAGGDKFKGKYTPENTPLSVNLMKDIDLTIDLGTGSVAGQ